MQSPDNYLIVKCVDIYDYWMQKGTLKLYVDPLFKKSGHRKITSGTIMGIPNKLGDGFDHVIPEAKVGDKAYFHYNALDDDAVIPNSDGLFIIPYDFLFAVVRNDQIIMIGGKVLLEPWYPNDTVEIEGVNGHKIRAKLSPSGMVTEIGVKPSDKKAVLRHIGTPLKGFDKVNAKDGDIVYYIKDGEFVNTIEGKEYYLMEQEDLLMKE